MNQLAIAVKNALDIVRSMLDQGHTVRADAYLDRIQNVLRGRPEYADLADADIYLTAIDEVMRHEK